MSARHTSDILLDGVVAVLLAATLILSFLQVVARYVFLVSTPWSEELARLLFVWGVFLGAAVGVKRDLHTRVDFIFQRLSARASALLLAGMDLLVAGMAVIMILYGAQLLYSTRTDFSTSLGYPRNLFYVPVPISGMLMLWFLIPGMIRRLAGRTPAAPAEKG
jgi:TRAP-type C4-dicarboxylate transport system permease small subunit